MNDFDREWFGTHDPPGFAIDADTDIHEGVRTVLVCSLCTPRRVVGSWYTSVPLVRVMTVAMTHRTDVHGEGW